MTSTPDRQESVALIDGVMAAGARQASACAELGLTARTLQRWTGPEGAICDDRRPFAEHPEPASKLSDEERDRIVATCNAPEFASLPPSQIVPPDRAATGRSGHMDRLGIQLLQGVART